MRFSLAVCERACVCLLDYRRAGSAFRLRAVKEGTAYFDPTVWWRSFGLISWKRNLFWKRGRKRICLDVKDVKIVREIERTGWFYKELQK
jgi:hypothetical protein